MSEIIPTKPYLLRALYEWCVDNGFTPYMAVKVQGDVHVPMEFVSDGEIILDISMDATHELKMDNDAITFKARFGGVPRDIYVPVSAVSAIYAGENNQGMAFDVVSVTFDAPAAEKETTEPSAAEKPPVTLAVTNTENSPAPDKKKSKENRKKPSFTVIK